MIRVAYGPSGTPGLLVEGDRTAFVDRDWLQSSNGGGIAALAIDAEGQLHYRDRRVGGGAQSPEREAAAIISAFVEDLLAAVGDTDRRSVEVSGDGVIASELRRRLGGAAQRGEEPSSTVVELTGRQDELLKATREVARGGLVVLAGESAGDLDLDVYADVHRRGLQVLGIPLPASGAGDRPDTFPEPISVRSGEPLPSGLWYRVDA